MPDWMSPVEIQKDFEVATILFWLAVGFSLREEMATAPFSWAVITGKRQRKWPQGLYFLVKLVWWTYILLNITLMYTKKEIDCQAMMYGIEALMGLVTLCSSVLLALRTICVYQDKARIIVVTAVTLLALGLAAAWGQGVNSVEAVWLPGQGKPWTDGACAFTNVRTDYSVKYIVTVVFDLTVLILTVVGVLRLEGTQTRLGHILIRQGVIYFLVTFIVNVLIAGFTIAQLNPVMSLILAVPTSAIAVAASTRLYVELAEETRPSKHREVSFTKENEESYFGTGSGGSDDSRKRSMFRSMFRRNSSADPEKLGQILTLNLGPISPLVGVQPPTPSQSMSQGLVLVDHGDGTDTIESIATPYLVQRDTTRTPPPMHPGFESSQQTRPSIDMEPTPGATTPSGGNVTPGGASIASRSGSSSSHRVHRKQPSLSVLPSAAAAAARLRIEQSRTVTSETMPAHLVPFATDLSPTQEEAVLREFPGLSRSSAGHGSSEDSHHNAFRARDHDAFK